MTSILLKKIIDNYCFNDSDAEVIKSLMPIFIDSTSEFSHDLHAYVFTFEHARAFLKTQEEIDFHKKKIELWFINLFTGVYEKDYYDYLSYINTLHKKIGLPPNYINSTFTFIRRFIRKKLVEAGRIQNMDSIEKILDLNLELLSTHYANEDFEETLHIIRILRDSLENDYIEPFLQKIVSAKDGQSESYECLCRINHPEHGIISPFKFLDISKQIDLYGEITKTMVRKALEIYKNTGQTFSINLSFIDIVNKDTAGYIEKMIKEYDPQGDMIIEIVESEDVYDIDILIKFCSDMQRLGLRVAIDDFGSGFSNFSNIDKIKPEFIKIDGSLIKDIDSNTINYAAVESIVDMSKKLGISTVAEYVHSEAVRDVCAGLGIDKLQGFLFGQPEKVS